MRIPATTARDVLHARLTAPAQDSALEPAGDLPPYMESFLAHIRMLVGVPFEYLVPDERLLPPESVRFFYLDRSWTDRLVDGAVAVGKIGSREQAHHQAHGQTVSQILDLSERMVRSLQRRADFETAKSAADADARPAEVVTGFILRSSAVKNWPHMDVRAYDTVIGEPYESADPAVAARQLKTLRIEVIAPSVLIALFEREPQMVILEEPHHGVQFGLRRSGSGFAVTLRDGTGRQIPVGNSPVPVAVPTRSRHNDVVRVAALRDALQAQGAALGAVDQTGSGAFAISLLDPPWRQHFEGTEDHADTGAPPPGPLQFVSVADVVRSDALLAQVKTILAGG